MTDLITPKAPNLPLVPADFEKRYFDTLSNVLRLYFNQNDNTFGALLGQHGGVYLTTAYIQAVNTGTITPVAADTAYRVPFSTLVMSNGMTVAVGDGAHVEHTGVYNVQCTLQFENTDTNVHTVAVWLRQNSSDVANTSTKWDIPAKHGSDNGYMVGHANYFVSLVAGDAIELWWATSSTTVNIEAYALQTSPYTRPAVPSVTVSVHFVSAR